MTEYNAQLDHDHIREKDKKGASERLKTDVAMLSRLSVQAAFSDDTADAIPPERVSRLMQTAISP